MVKISSIFVAFLEKMNFKKPPSTVGFLARLQKFSVLAHKEQKCKISLSVYSTWDLKLFCVLFLEEDARVVMKFCVTCTIQCVSILYSTLCSILRLCTGERIRDLDAI